MVLDFLALKFLISGSVGFSQGGRRGGREELHKLLSKERAGSNE